MICAMSGSLEGWGGVVVAAGAADAEPGPQVCAARALETLVDGVGAAGQLPDDVFAGVAEVEEVGDVVDPLLALAECGADGCCVGPGDGFPVVAGGLVGLALPARGYGGESEAEASALSCRVSAAESVACLAALFGAERVVEARLPDGAGVAECAGVFPLVAAVFAFGRVVEGVFVGVEVGVVCDASAGCFVAPVAHASPTRTPRSTRRRATSRYCSSTGRPSAGLRVERRMSRRASTCASSTGGCSRRCSDRAR